jgi:ABC-type iron transport system FetAB permease component
MLSCDRRISPRSWIGSENCLRTRGPGWLYGLVLLALPLRCLSASTLTWSLLITYGLYLIVSIYVHRRRIDRYMLLPLYAAFSSLVMTPLGTIWYFVMAARHRNTGLIRPRCGTHHTPA